MTDTTCPRCDAPAPPGARGCARCGYSFLEDSGPGRKGPHPSARQAVVAVGATAVLAVAVAGVALLTGGGDGGAVASDSSAGTQLDRLAPHPISTPAAERLLERRYFGTKSDESASVSCSGRIPEPAHSVRRCRVHYPGGMERRVVLVTTANGQEVITQP
jgi:ribosomal protein L40E